MVHCLDAETGKLHWTHDMYSTCWLGPPLIVDGKVYICDEDGDVTIFKLAKEKTILAEMNMRSAMYTAPIVANGVLYIANKTALFAIAKGAQSASLGPMNAE
jgi:outer membrane protein assembly factor BamB